MPIGNATRDKWPSYIEDGIKGQDPFDMYFVDGRFRVACAVQALLHGMSGGRSREDFVVLIHDFAMDKELRGYQVLLSVADLIDGSPGTLRRRGNLAVLRRKAGVTDEQLKLMLENYKYQEN